MKKILIYLIFISSFTTIISCSETNGKDNIYLKEIKKFRFDKDSSFRFSDTSPIPEDERDNFQGLNYYAPDMKYVVKAKFIPNKKPDTIIVSTTQPDDKRTMLRIGKFVFKLNGKTHTLFGYVSVPLEYPVDVFMPFADKTNGKETYEVGRYLDFTLNSTDKFVTLDFNLAYSPYCAYNKKFSCPLVPDENILKVYIKAGEKILKKE